MWCGGEMDAKDTAKKKNTKEILEGRAATRRCGPPEPRSDGGRMKGEK